MPRHKRSIVDGYPSDKDVPNCAKKVKTKKLKYSKEMNEKFFDPTDPIVKALKEDYEKRDETATTLKERALSSVQNLCAKTLRGNDLKESLPAEVVSVRENAADMIDELSACRRKRKASSPKTNPIHWTKYVNKTNKKEKKEQAKQIILLLQRIKRIEERLEACEIGIVKVKQPMIRKVKRLSHKMLNKVLSRLDENETMDTK